MVIFYVANCNKLPEGAMGLKNHLWPLWIFGGRMEDRKKSEATYWHSKIPQENPCFGGPQV